MSTEEKAPSGNVVAEGSNAVSEAPTGPPWLRASVTDLDSLDFEAPIASAQSADSNELGDLYRAAVGSTDANATPDTPSSRIFTMLAAVMGMHLRAQEPNEPFGAMIVFSDGRRTAAPSDFLGAPIDVLAQMAERAKHPVLKARLADVCWLLDRKRGPLGTMAIAAYVEIVKQVDTGVFKFRYDNKEPGALKHEARDLLRRALSIGRGLSLGKGEPSAARQVVTDLRSQSFEKQLPIPALWFGHLDLDFAVSDPGEIGKRVESLIAVLPSKTDGHTVVNLWRLARRAYHSAKNDQDKHRSQSEAAEQLARMAEQQPLAMLASSLLTEAITELHSVPGKKDRRKELRHRLVDVQAGIADEISSFTHTTNIEEIAKGVQQHMRRPSLREKLFAFAALSNSPDPAELATQAAESIREHPLASLIAATKHDREGKVVHRSEGAGFGDGENESAIERQIAEHERIRRNLTAAGQIEVARLSIVSELYLSDDIFAHLFVHSVFVPADLVMTFSRGFVRFFQGDMTGAVYILTPLLENSLRHVLKNHGHDVTKFDDAKMIQEDRTISSLFEQMREELDSIFGRPLTTDIENVFLKKSGPYLRHALSHGLLHDGDPYGADAIYGCWLIFRLCLLPLFPYWTQLALPFDSATEEQAVGAEAVPG